jgi:hypothetical protein
MAYLVQDPLDVTSESEKVLAALRAGRGNRRKEAS